MKKNIIEKILSDHLIEGKLVPGQEIGIKIDQTLTQDATGTMAYLQFESLEKTKIATELSVSYIDHNTIQDGFENADDHRYLQAVAEKYGVIYSKAGNGICHQVHLERFGLPGKTLLGSDSHTPTGGGVGMLAIGAGGLDVAMAMAGKPFYLTCPRVIKINLSGRLSPWVSSKDIILKILQILTTKGNVGIILEYGGDGVASLTVPERATITNMGAELGVTTSIFPSDEITEKFLKAQNRATGFKRVFADDDAAYDKVININISELVPMAALPHSPDNIKRIDEIAGIPVDQVAIGSCTNSSFLDLMRVAAIVKGKKISPTVSAILAPGSKQVLEMIARNGALADILSSGIRLMEATCGFCIGNGQAPQTNAISIRTNNRNFEGRSGTKSAKIYLTSPETAAASALSGVITDPRTLTMEFPHIVLPDTFIIDDSMLLAPAEHPEDVTIPRGPNIGEPPELKPLRDDIEGPVAIKVKDKITTDHIMPAGSRLKYRSNIPKYAQFVFESIDGDFYRKALANKKKHKANIIVGGLSYGQGSSREHAAICPMYLGVQAIIAKSFERIHSQNLINFGIIPLVFQNEKDYEKIEVNDTLQIKNIRQQIEKGADITVLNQSKNFSFHTLLSVSSRQKNILLKGGLLNLTKDEDT
ncbi:MAG: aconitate hydratase [bacterium]